MGFCLEIGNFFLEIGKNYPYLALGMGPNIGPVRLAEKALGCMIWPIGEQCRSRSAGTSMPSDQDLHCSLLESLVNF
jgi:hypothetical protein